MKTLIMNLVGCFLIVAGVFTMSGCSQTAPPDMALSEELQEEAVEGAKSIIVSDEETKEGAKVIFVTGDGPSKKKPTSAKKKRKEKYIGIAYWIELLTPDGKRILTTKDRVFKAGDRIKLNVESNRRGFLYIVNIGTTGKNRLLFPRSHEDNLIEKRKVYSVPYDAYMQFDNNRGEETLMVLLSPKEIKNFDSRKLQASYKGSKDILIEEADANSIKDMLVNESRSADYEYAAPVAGVIVAPLLSLEKQREAISLRIKLKHN